MNQQFASRIAVVVFLAGAPALANSQASPSFDCSKATGEVEKLVCADEELAALDRTLADVYAKALESWPADEASKERAMQRGWIKGRNECWKAEDLRSCVEAEYRTRTVELQIGSGQLVVPTPVRYVCEGGDDRPFLATFYSDTDPPSALITYGDDRVIALASPSSTGTKYVANGMEFREHDHEARVDWYGTSLVCMPSGTASATGAAFDQTLELLGITFRVTSTNNGTTTELSIAPSELEIDNRPFDHDIDGTVVGAEVGDLNVDQSPEVYVYVRSRGKDATGSVVAYSANNRKSLSQIYLPPVANHPEASVGYRGHDEFAVVENFFVQRFPIYRDGDEDGKPTGGTRQLRYELGPGEAGWVLTLVKITEF